MPISIPSVVPPQGIAPVSLEQLLQPGAVVEARVVAQLNASLVRILIANVAIDVATEAPLTPGTVLRLEVSRAGEGGLKLTPALLPAPAAPSATPTAPSAASAVPSATSSAPSGTRAAPAIDILRPVAPDPEAAAVALAVREAAPRQGGLSPLFANLAAALEQRQLPPQVRAAAAPILDMRPELAAGLTAPQLQKALQQSGLLLESSIAAGRLPQAQSPDLKAALIVLRQVLSQWQGALAPPLPASSSPAATSAALPATAVPAMQSSTPIVPAPPLAPSTSTALNPSVADDVILALTTQTVVRREAAPQPRTISAGVVLTMLQDVAHDMHEAIKAVASTQAAAPRDTAGARLTPQTQPDAPAPPWRGATPSAQVVALPAVRADDTPPAVAQKLIESVDGALARQTLLQIASLPDQPVPQGQRNEQPRWAFEIPFATPQGTAVAQFEIARDGHSTHEVATAKRIWRARFSLDVEPAGPVHASIALTGERTSVRMWADRPETIARLRDLTPLLSHALREAELEPGEIVIGRPPQAAPVASGQFWNRAS